MTELMAYNMCSVTINTCNSPLEASSYMFL